MKKGGKNTQTQSSGGKKQPKKIHPPSETIEEVVNRLENEGENFIEWDDVMDFFSRKGRPEYIEPSAKQQPVKDKLANRLMERDTSPGVKAEETQTFAAPAKGAGGSDDEGRGRGRRDSYDSDQEVERRGSSGTRMRPASRRLIKDRLHKKKLEAISSGDESFERLDEFDGSIGKVARRSGGGFGSRSLSEMRLHHKVYADLYQGLRKDYDEFGITVPEKNLFEIREERRDKPIMARRMEQWLAEKTEQEDFLRRNTFRANSVPAHVKQPLFAEITAKNEERRANVKKMSVTMTLQNEKPFSFYYRDLEAAKSRKEAEETLKRTRPRSASSFRARPVPWMVQATDLFSKMKVEEAAERKEKVIKRALQNLLDSKFPPRMEKYEKTMSERRLRGESAGKVLDQHSFQPPRARPIPDFDRLQASFQQLLDSKKKAKRPTKPKDFNFTQLAPRVTKRDYLNQTNQQTKAVTEGLKHKDRQARLEKLKEKPAIEVGLTKKVIALASQRQKEREIQKAKEQALEREEMERKQKKLAMAPRVHATLEVIHGTKPKVKLDMDEIRERAKQQNKREQENYESWKAAIEAKARNTPFLFERVTTHKKKKAIKKEYAETVKENRPKKIITHEEPSSATMKEINRQELSPIPKTEQHDLQLNKKSVLFSMVVAEESKQIESSEISLISKKDPPKKEVSPPKKETSPAKGSLKGADDEYADDFEEVE